MIINNRYEFDSDSLLGQGGLGRVYKGKDLYINKDVIIKVGDIQSHVPYERLKSIYQLEFKTASKFNHFNLIKALDFYEVNGACYGIYEFASGVDFRKFAEHSLSKEVLINILLQILNVLEYLHSCGIVHRDVKPANILINQSNLMVKLLDLGIAFDKREISSLGNQFGTLFYGAPEQFFSSYQDISPATDLWSLGVTLYEIIRGKHLYKIESLFDNPFAIYNSFKGEPKIEGIDEIEEPFKKIIELCLVSDRNKRVQSASELITVLNKYVKESNSKSLKLSVTEGLVLDQLKELNRITIDLKKDISLLKRIQTQLLQLVPKEKEKIKILFLGANPISSPLRLDEEIRKISTNLKLAKERDRLELKQEWAITVDSIMQALLDENPTFVHFSGHGNEDGIVIEDELGNLREISTDALTSLFKVFKETISCVFLNSCFSKNQAQAINLHIPFVIGMDKSIPDNTAISFSSGFYQAIGAGRSIKESYDIGIVKIKLQNLEGDDIPQLYQ